MKIRRPFFYLFKDRDLCKRLNSAGTQNITSQGIARSSRRELLGAPRFGGLHKSQAANCPGPYLHLFMVAMRCGPARVCSVQMKFFWLMFSLAAAPIFSASAQVTVSLTLDQNQFLPSETLPVTVHITNLSGQTLHLGADPHWLRFSVMAADDFIVVKNSDPPVQGAFTLESSEVATKVVNLEPYFNLGHTGHYQIVATVKIKDWNTEITSAPVGFDIIHGAKLWSQVFGLPLPPGVTNRPPEVRKYTLEEANYLRSQLRMYVQVSNQSGSTIFKVRSIGPMVSFSQPETQLDRFSNLHVLYQNGASSFLYSVINPDGDIIQQQVYDYVNVRPRLRVGDDGSVTVYGGVLRSRHLEIPPVESSNQPSAPAKR